MAVILNQNQENDQNQPQTGPNGQPLQTIGTAAPSGQAPSGGPMAASQANSLAQQQRKGSGRFTNLQKYLNANQQGGQQVANQVGQGMQKQFGEQSDKAKSYYGQLGENINQANQVAQQGKGFQTQLQGIGSEIKSAQDAGFDQRNNQTLGSIEQFTQNPNFNQFQNIQAGRAIDENLLGLQQQRALTAAQQAAQDSQAAQQSLGSEGGRFNLLRQTFGGDGRTNYTQGQQRLDQVLFGQGGGLGKLQADASQATNQALAQQKLANASRGDVNRLVEQERGLISDIGTQTSANEKAYMDMLQSYIDPLNKQRGQEFEQLGSAVGTYVPTYKKETDSYDQQTWQPGFNEDQMARLGLTDQNQGVYNVFRDEAFTKAPGTTPEARNAALANVIASKGMDAQNAQDVANTQDVARYQALSKIMGQNSPQNITQASQIGDAWTAKNDDSGLKQRLTAAQTVYDAAAKNKLSSRFGGPKNSIYLTPEEAIQNARDSVRTNTWDTGDMRLSDFENRLRTNLNSANRSTLQRIDQQDVPGLYSQLQNFLADQNYNRTLGGRRNTFLDTQGFGRDPGTPIKMDPTPITGEDPNKSQGTK